VTYPDDPVDRNAIERTDFPLGRRGYEQGAVDDHLRRVADEFERLEGRAAVPAATSLSAGTSEQVRGILEAAERSAAELREDAGRQAGEHVARVGAAADGMLQRLEALEGELGELLAGLRRSGERLSQELSALQASVSDVPGAEPAAAPEPEPAPETPPEPAPAAERGDDEAGARIIALNMALGGSAREETASYLDEHFELADRDGLLDDVYAKVQQ
jgi:DivIVA domain-containing protein